MTGKRTLQALAVTLGLGAAALSGPARAQFFGWDNGGWDNGGWGGLPGPQVRRSLTAQGFRVIGPLRRNRGVFVADVIDGRGQHERLIVGAADAQILQRFFVDDGRASPRLARGFDDEDGGLVPPADIPGVPRPPVARPSRGPDGSDTAVVEPPPLRAKPPIKIVRPGSQVVERAPEVPAGREPGAVEATPLAPKPRTVEPAARAAVPKVPASVASRPDAAPPAPSPAPAAPVSAPRRMTDPLAIPGSPAKAADSAPPARTMSGSAADTPLPAPVAAPAPAVKPADVPAAPLD